MDRARLAARKRRDDTKEVVLTGNILMLGANAILADALERGLEGTSVRNACCVADTEGLGNDVVVIACDHPFEELAQVRVHPYLFSRPVVLLAPGQNLDAAVWRRGGVWPVTSLGFDQVDDVVRGVAQQLARLHHPSAASLTNQSAA